MLLETYCEPDGVAVFVFAAGCTVVVVALGDGLVSTAAFGASALSAGGVTLSAAGVSLAGDADTVGDGNGFVPAGTLSSTEREPVNAGSDKTIAININVAAAPMPIFASSVCVPRGPKAVLEIEFVKSAPASALPG